MSDTTVTNDATSDIDVARSSLEDGRKSRDVVTDLIFGGHSAQDANEIVKLAQRESESGSPTVKQVKAQVNFKLLQAREDAESYAAEHLDDPADASKLVQGVFSGAAAAQNTQAASPRALSLDFDADLPAPDWLVAGAIERGTVTVLSGDTGAAKSIVASALLAAAVQGDDWLGLRTSVERVTVIDAENPARLVQARLRALGIENGSLDRFRYFSREQIAIGDAGESDAWLRGHLEDFKPDLVIVDTLMAACAVSDTNSNSEAVRVMSALRALAAEYGCAILLLHHERKQHKDYPSSSGQAMMGARQWAGQADAHMTLTVESDLLEENGASDGQRTLRRTFRWRPAEKDRDGRANRIQRVAVASEKDDQGRLLWMAVENDGDVDEALTETDALAHQIGAFVQRGESETGTADIAKAVGKDAKDGTFIRAAASACARSYIEKIKRGRYAPGSELVLDV